MVVDARKWLKGRCLENCGSVLKAYKKLNVVKESMCWLKLLLQCELVGLTEFQASGWVVSESELERGCDEKGSERFSRQPDPAGKRS